MVNVTKSKEGFLSLKVNRNKGKSDFVKEVVKNNTSRLPLLKRVKCK